MISFQLVIFPLDSFIAVSPVVLAVFNAYSQYDWLSMVLPSSSYVSISSRYLLSGGRLQRPMSSWWSISFMMSCFALSLIVLFVWWCLVMLRRIHCEWVRSSSFPISPLIQASMVRRVVDQFREMSSTDFSLRGAHVSHSSWNVAKVQEVVFSWQSRYHGTDLISSG